jgi:hypothetical protein
MESRQVKSFSYTQLAMLQKCGVQYEFRYVKGIKAPPGIALIRGRGVDEATRLNLSQKVKSRQEAPEDVVADAAAQAVDEGFAGELALTEEEQTVGTDKLKGRTKDTAVGLALLHRAKVSPTFQPVAVQKKITLTPNPKALSKSLVGYLDVEDEAGAVRDTKSSKRTPGGDAAEKSDQLTMYALLTKAQKGTLPSAVILDTLIETEAGNRSIDTKRSVRTDADLDRLVLRLQAAEKSIQAGLFLPTNPESWWCSRNWCGYYRMCPFVKQ